MLSYALFLLSDLILILQIVCCIYHLYYLLLKYFCKALILILISGSCLDNITHFFFIFPSYLDYFISNLSVAENYFH